MVTLVSPPEKMKEMFIATLAHGTICPPLVGFYPFSSAANERKIFLINFICLFFWMPTEVKFDECNLDSEEMKRQSACRTFIQLAGHFWLSDVLTFV